MNDPQVWTLIGAFVTLIGVFSAIMFAMLRFNNLSLIRQMNARFDATDARFDATDARFDATDARLEMTNTRIDEQGERITAVMDVRFADVDHRLSNLEGDMNLVKAHLLGQQSA